MAPRASSRWGVLSGPSKTARVCDEDCVVGGCGEGVPDDEGVLCAGCGLFLCRRCFGTIVVRAEVAVGGRCDQKGEGGARSGHYMCLEGPGHIDE